MKSLESRGSGKAPSTKCLYCGVFIELPPNKRGRKRQYCSNAHRQRAYEQRQLRRAYERGLSDAIDRVRRRERGPW